MSAVYEVYSRSELPLPELPQLKTRRLWDMVFTHSSLPNGNRVIAALGHRIIGTCVTEWLIDADPGLNNTELMTRHAERVNDPLLAAFADEHALTPRLQYSKSTHKSSRLSTEAKATLFAAYVGAVYRDHGYVIVKDWIFALMDWDNDTMLQILRQAA
ncbi:hypothetical protein BS47DRAFT_586021 [Hydnum rufescens UP504]|uniref:RNase III domain-containing protein n=1 Tax=Hydnum rufescens UP504 TaxID=1448309 RepID=A0A9P6B3F3_9AGAM|nr:hypothetical protein BS47DRAFT_586021 [Hydnum rufescens UP504]